MSDIIVKIERSNGEIFYKCDTFWSLSKTKKEAKIHNLIDNDIEDHLLKNLLYVINLKTPDIDKEVLFSISKFGDIIPTKVAEGLTDKESKYEIRKFDARKTWQ